VPGRPTWSQAGGRAAFLEIPGDLTYSELDIYRGTGVTARSFAWLTCAWQPACDGQAWTAMLTVTVRRLQRGDNGGQRRASTTAH